jgi:hypothetical protein
VIVVQRSPSSTEGAAAAKDTNDSQAVTSRLVQAKMGSPVMLVSKSPGSGPPRPFPGQTTSAQTAVVLNPAIKGSLQAMPSAPSSQVTALLEKIHCVPL